MDVNEYIELCVCACVHVCIFMCVCIMDR